VEKNARIRDLEIENEKFKQDHHEVSKDELEKAMETMAKATGKELYIGTKKSPTFESEVCSNFARKHEVFK
ncbi:hypothetical protein, partial [Xenorhabdus szentirmaii]